LQLESKDQETLRQYLLGNLPPEERASLEERLLTDDEFYQELLIVEDELVDQYLSGDQSKAERESFEAHFLLAPERQQKVRFSRTLKKYLHHAEQTAANANVVARVAAAEPVPVPAADRGSVRMPFFSFLKSNPVLAYSLAAAVVLVIGLVSRTALRNPVSQGPSQVLAVALTPGLTRDSGEVTKISIPPGTDTLQLKLQLPQADYTSYRARLVAADQSELWSAEDLKPVFSNDTRFIEANIPSHVVKPGDYEIKVAGRLSSGQFEDAQRFTFRVNR
jgi:hypothetical protein